jgi:hypothetical protein
MLPALSSPHSYCYYRTSEYASIPGSHLEGGSTSRGVNLGVPFMDSTVQLWVNETWTDSLI